VTDRLLQLIPSTESNPGADHYKQEAKQALNTIIAALQACRLKFNVIDLVVLLMNQKAMIELENTLTVRAPQTKLRSTSLCFSINSGCRIGTRTIPAALT
jgi:intracellular multiplication protein IcmO